MTNLLDLCAMPDIQDNILKHLGVRDIKALRLTCRETSDWVDNSSVKSKWGGVSATIDLSRKSKRNTKQARLDFDSLSALPFPVWELRLQNYKSPDLLHVLKTGGFLQSKGAGVKTLRMDFFFGGKYDDEVAFFEGLSGLQELRMDKLKTGLHFDLLQADSLRFPSAIQNVQTLDMNSHVNLHYYDEANFKRMKEIVCALRFTMVLQLPYGTFWTDLQYLHHVRETLIARLILEGVAKTDYTHVDLSSLRTYSYSISPQNRGAMNMLLGHCLLCSIKVLNVAPKHILSGLPDSPFLHLAEHTVESIVGWHCSLKRFRSNALKELRIPSSAYLQYDTEDLMHPSTEVNENYCWPNLELLHVTFDAYSQSARQLISCGDVSRALHLGPITVPESELNRSGLRVSELGVTFFRRPCRDMTPSSFLEPFSVVKYYPNLKILKISGWDAENDEWIRLWKGLSKLEEVHIEDCRKLGYGGFTNGWIHEPTAMYPASLRTDRPIFCELRNLKKLTLKLNDKTRVTDFVFRDVFAHLRLEEFYLHTETSGNICSKMLSRQALKYLANGPFGRSVKKFPFDTFSLDDTTHEELQQLKFRFPSAYF